MGGDVVNYLNGTKLDQKNEYGNQSRINCNQNQISSGQDVMKFKAMAIRIFRFNSCFLGEDDLTLSENGHC